MKQYPKLRYLFTILFLFSFPPEILAQEGGYHKITAPEVQGMMKNNNIVIINTLSEIEYELQHIPGSINIPINTLGTPGVLPEDTKTPLIFYCMASL